MPGYEFTNFAHIVAFSYILAADLPVYLALRIAMRPNQVSAAGIFAAYVAKWTGAIAGLALIALLPLGVVLGVTLGVYDLADPSWLTATWGVACVWLILFAAAEFLTGTWGRRLFVSETAFRFLMGLGNIYDGFIGLLGNSGQTNAPWLATKILIYGVVLLLSSLSRWRMRSVRYAVMESNYNLSSITPDTEGAFSARSIDHTILITTFLVLTAAWLGMSKPYF